MNQQNNIKIVGITTTYNIEEKIPYVMPYYERMEIDKLVIYDNYSTDNTIKELSKYPFVEIRYYETDSFNDWEILKIKNNVWKEFKDEYDWCIVCDFDEVLYSRRDFKTVLAEKTKEGKTYLNKIGLNLLSREFPKINDKLIHENVKYGFIWDCDDDIPGTWGNKVLLFDIKNTNIEYTEIGAHNCHIPEENNKPFDDDISFFHLKLIDFNYVLKLSTLYHERIKKHSINAYSNFIENLEEIYQKSIKKSIPIDFYIDSPGKIIYPSLLLLIEDIKSLEDGKIKIDNFTKKINKNIFYGVGLVVYNSSNIDYNYDELFLYAKNKGISTFIGERLNNMTINEWMIGYSYLFKNNMKFNNPWITMSNNKILNNLSNPNLLKTLNENKLNDKIYFDNIELTRFNKFIEEDRKSLGCYLIVKNEEKNIKTCLDNLSKVCDEILVVDTGSNDNTVNIVKTFNNIKLDYFKWVDDFSSARNYAMSKMKSDYIFTIDADEILTDNLIEKINNLKLENFNGVSSLNMFIELDYNHFYLGGRQIVKNNPNNIWKYSVHEKLYYDETNDVIVNGENTYIIHKPHNSTSNYNKYAEIYYNEINKGDFLKNENKAHYFYYLFFTLKNIDPFLAKKYLYNCFDIERIDSKTENQGFNLWECDWINNDDYYLNSLIGGYKNINMVKPYYKKLNNDLNKLICLDWCYKNGDELTDNDYINLSYLSYHFGLFNDFIKYTKELNDKYPNNEIGKNNIEFIKNNVSILNNYNIIIDCREGFNCLPSTIHLINQYNENAFILCNNINNIKKYELLQMNIINEIPKNNKKNIFIKAIKQYDRIYLKNIFNNLIYGIEPNEENIYIK